jgi:excisionase family DNA binding protein
MVETATAKRYPWGTELPYGYMTIPDAAADIGVDRKTVWRWVNQKKVSFSYHVRWYGRYCLIAKRDFHRWKRQCENMFGGEYYRPVSRLNPAKRKRAND